MTHIQPNKALRNAIFESGQMQYQVAQAVPMDEMKRKLGWLPPKAVPAHSLTEEEMEELHRKAEHPGILEIAPPDPLEEIATNLGRIASQLEVLMQVLAQRMPLGEE